MLLPYTAPPLTYARSDRSDSIIDNESEENDSDSDMTFRKTVVFTKRSSSGSVVVSQNDVKVEDEKDFDMKEEDVEVEEKEEEDMEEEEDMSGYIEELLHAIKRMSRRRLLLFRKQGSKKSTVLDLIRVLWNSECFRKNLIHCCESGILSSGVKRLYEDVETICKDDWIPNAEEMMTSRRYFQHGLSSHRVNIAGHLYEMIDPLRRVAKESCNKYTFDRDFMRSARKWIFQFSNATALIYVVSLSSYDQVLDLNNPYKSDLQRSLEQFEELCKLSYLKDVFKIVILNKVDLFLKKIKKIDLRDESKLRFLDYKGGCSSSNAMTYIRALFTKAANGETIYIHSCCALDDSSLRVAFLYIRKEIIKSESRKRWRDRIKRSDDDDYEYDDDDDEEEEEEKKGEMKESKDVEEEEEEKDEGV